MKHKYPLAAFLLYYIFSLSFGEGRGEVFAQQLSPRYFKIATNVTLSLDTVLTFSDAVPTNRRGEMVGIANGISGHGGIPVTSYGTTTFTDYIPYIYRLDSMGNFIFLKNFKIPKTGLSKPYFIEKIVPHKDSLYIWGSVEDNDYTPAGGSQSTNKFILKTDSAGNVAWQNKLGYYSGGELLGELLPCKDGGVLVSGDVNLLWSYSGGIPHSRYAAFITKYNADGTIWFNKAFRSPLGNDIADTAAGMFSFNAIAETPDKGYLMAGSGGKLTTGIGAYPAGPFMVKLDADGNKLWEKLPLYDTTLFRGKWLSVANIIAHPSGGYVLVGSAQINDWDSTALYNYNEINGKKHYYSFNRSGGFMMKINETGDVEWTKIFRSDYKVNTKEVHREQEILLSGISLSLTNGVPSGFVLKGSAYAPSSILGGTAIIKTDLNGNLIWNKQYYYAGAPSGFTGGYGKTNDIFEEPGGSIVVNAFADPEPVNSNYNTEKMGIIRLNSKGDFGDGSCSLSPKIAVLNESSPVTYDTDVVIFETTPPLTGNLPPAGTFNRKKPDSYPATCLNPFLAEFSYPIMGCSNSGTKVKFSNQSTGASWFSYNFGDPAASKQNNTSDSAYTQHLYPTAGTYTVTLTVWDGDSTNVDSVKHVVEIKPIRYITVLPGNTTICQGIAFDLNATISNGLDFETECSYCAFSTKEGYDLSAITSSLGINYFNSNASTFGTTLSFFMGTSNSCIISDTAVITILPKVSMSLRGENTTLCIGDSALLIASGSNSYLWSPGGTTNDSLKVYLAGTYTVSSGQTKVCGTDSALIKVIVNPLPLVDAGPDQTIFPGKQAPLLATGGTAYSWSPTLGLNATNIANPIAEPEQNTSYFVKVTDANGCVSSDSVTINLKFCGVDLFVPNAFSPNGDNQNDVFYVKTLNNNCIQTFELKIFDRWGNKVFESQDINTGWNGAYGSTSLTTGSGKAMDSGVFVYFLNAVLEAGEIVTRKGNITLLR